MREVAAWPDDKKMELISPGSIVSILTNEKSTTHTIIFNSWIKPKDKPIESYTGISGCNKAMVWAHAPLFLPSADWANGKTEEEILKFDAKCFFGVPNQANQTVNQSSDRRLGYVEQLPAAKRVAECLRILKSGPLSKDLRQQYISIFVKDAKNLSWQYGKSKLDIKEDLWVEILLEGLANNPVNQDIVFALAHLLINSRQYLSLIHI